ncbi:MAG: hypothetical protein WCW33_02675 [Candidatus Babeliales bacterium]|jgi:hypothetical protein
MQRIWASKYFKRSIVVAIIMIIIIPSLVLLIKKASIVSSSSIQELFVPRVITYELNSVFDASLRISIQKFIESRINKKSLLAFDRAMFYKELKHHFPIIKSIEYELRPSEVLHCNIVGVTPLCRINECFILGNKRRLFPCSLFSEINQEALPNVVMDRRWLGKKISPHLYYVIHSITKEQWASYHIAYYAPWNIQLMPRTSICRCRIITDEHNLFNQQKFGALSSIFNDLCNRGLISKKMLGSKGVPLAFDFRIKNQVIVQFHESSKRGRGL